MKLNIDWKTLAMNLLKAVWPVIAGALTGATVAATSGCSSMTPSSKTQTMGVYAFGIPGIAVITQSTQNEDARGMDVNAQKQEQVMDAK